MIRFTIIAALMTVCALVWVLGSVLSHESVMVAFNLVLGITLGIAITVVALTRSER